MRSSLRGMLLLGTAVAAFSMSAARADDPLVPEGAERPKMGKELVLPPILNEAPPGAKIELPPPGQEHLLGKRADGTFASAEKTEARVSDEPATETVAAEAAQAEPEPHAESPKKARKRKERAQAVADASAPAKAADAKPAIDTAADKPLYSSLNPTKAPDQSMVVAEGKTVLSAEDETPSASGGIVQTDRRMDDLAKPAMGGPELSGPPKPTDGMTDAPAPVRDGDTLTKAQEKQLARAEAKPEPEVKLNPGRMAKTAEAPQAPAKAEAVKPAETAPTNAPAIERFEIAQATAAPMPVTPVKAMNSAEPDWDVEFHGGVGFGRVETARQRYFALADAGTGAVISNALFSSDDEDEVVTYEAAARFNLTGAVEPLGGGSNVTPYVKAMVSGYDAKFSNSGGPISAGTVQTILVQGGGGEGGYQPPVNVQAPLIATAHANGGAGGTYSFSSIDNIKYRGKENAIRALLEYGQTWTGSTGVDITGFAQIAHSRRDYRHHLSFTGFGLGMTGGGGGEGGETGAAAIAGAAAGYDGTIETDLDSDTTSFGLGAAVSVPLSANKRLKADANVRGSYDITTAKGHDSVRIVDNGTGGVTGASSARLRKTGESFGYGAGIGVSYQVTESIGVRLGADYESHEAAPVVVRSGVNASQIEFDREDVLTGTVTATWKF